LKLDPRKIIEYFVMSTFGNRIVENSISEAWNPILIHILRLLFDTTGF